MLWLTRFVVGRLHVPDGTCSDDCHYVSFHSRTGRVIRAAFACHTAQAGG